ncbi:TetR/AcrR family transcriptional regulator [Phreatobacter stygius]|uniref:TetR/AcrR family transcriptional regulator n=1 Tax=Phreatobacter stygius TaxID=1940610 RepID=A0A4D7B7W5_9HYPH|nr:TetR/AcrR family transcriptional regulator [Phreatobacter stygius]QCI64027.1 TetR/AcrR family transcriptional regulator [Phreatobacter stygius]
MQQAKQRSNRERTETTRHALLSAARGLFVVKGYAETSTPEIVALAGTTRGALYHHFADKRALFRALLEQEARAVAEAIEAQASSGRSAVEALTTGSTAYLDAMTVAGRTRLLLVEGPAVLGSAEMTALDEANAGRTLRDGLAAAMSDQAKAAVPLSALAVLLSAAFDRAALAIDAGADPVAFRAAVTGLIARVVGAGGGRGRD